MAPSVHDLRDQAKGAITGNLFTIGAFIVIYVVLFEIDWFRGKA